VTLQVCINFADAESAQRGVKYVRVGVEMLRAKIATQLAAHSLLEVAEDLGIEKDGPDIPPALGRLMERTEKALQRVKVAAHAKTVPVSLTIPVDARTVASAASAIMELVVAVPAYSSDPSQRFKELEQQSENLRQFYEEWNRFWMLNHPSNMNFDFVRGGDGPDRSVEFLKVPLSGWKPLAEALPPPHEAPSPACQPYLPAGIRPGVTSMSQPGIVSEAPMKLAIANVAKEPALLFLQSEGGQLTFERKVPAGEAVDVETTARQRWVAIFAENPSSENYVAAPDKTTWLLRGAPRKSIIIQAAPVGSVNIAPPLAR
jgi:hypothetical protein